MVAQKRRSITARRARRAVLVDIENIAGGAVLNSQAAGSAWGLITAHANIRPTDHVIVGVSHNGLLACWMTRQNARFVVRSGVDGADLALLEVLQHEHIAERFDEVLLISGDGIFAPIVAALGGAGTRVTVAGRKGHVSTKLRLAAAETVLFEQTTLSMGDVA